jgi:hypothetical protein
VGVTPRLRWTPPASVWTCWTRQWGLQAWRTATCCWWVVQGRAGAGLGAAYRASSCFTAVCSSNIIRGLPLWRIATCCWWVGGEGRGEGLGGMWCSGMGTACHGVTNASVKDNSQNHHCQHTQLATVLERLPVPLLHRHVPLCVGNASCH